MTLGTRRRRMILVQTIKDGTHGANKVGSIFFQLRSVVGIVLDVVPTKPEHVMFFVG